ncbi:serine hydrolase [Nakamurella lactea]|uniref:serine hydrolase n=1 Tax=Nakamurella lactea TaxID=459515 RepID=UPI000413161C|nr:serine hydrolase [Nakamurella lactea]
MTYAEVDASTSSPESGWTAAPLTAAARAGADVFAHALDIDSGAEVGINSDHPVVTASVFKVPVLTEYVRQVSSGELDPNARVTIRAGSATIGPTGLSVFSDDTEWSLRDVATSMITVSDNGATDIVTGMVGVDRVNATMRSLGLPSTALIGDCAALFASMSDDFGTTDPERVEQLMVADPGRIATMSVCTPERTNRSTPRESARLLQLLWTDQAAGPAACAEARRILGLQIWPHRLSSGFPRDDVKISGKTGTIGIVRNEIGVVEFPDGHRYAVAVFTRSHAFGYRQPAVDALIGTVAAALVDRLANA